MYSHVYTHTYIYLNIHAYIYMSMHTIFYFMPEFSSSQLLRVVPQTGNFVFINLFRTSCTLKAIKYFRVIYDSILKEP